MAEISARMRERSDVAALAGRSAGGTRLRGRWARQRVGVYADGLAYSAAARIENSADAFVDAAEARRRSCTDAMTAVAGSWTPVAGGSRRRGTL